MLEEQEWGGERGRSLGYKAMQDVALSLRVLNFILGGIYFVI